MAEREVAEEFFNQDHPRASITDDGTMLIDPGQVLDNIAQAMERVDLDISVEVSIDDDVAPLTELHAMVGNLMLGPTLAIHVVNSAMRIMSARYPTDLVTRPLPADYDLRTILALDIDDEHHDIAKTIFNQRTTSERDLTEDDVFDLYEPLDVGAQLQIFVGLFFMYGTKINALKQHTGIP